MDSTVLQATIRFFVFHAGNRITNRLFGPRLCILLTGLQSQSHPLWENPISQPRACLRLRGGQVNHLNSRSTGHLPLLMPHWGRAPYDWSIL
ncbi:hypothetical protein BDV37DRAFT_258397 [Aspergillus pseudonomiae]|uniref:Uncharacterized protein n=1 Tax=Aspergillus pseudonomiae TaxID=1506151 RepID=A0A5N7D2R4_9EURO|nr:uncharacterized protein BDV37DRAFT_258397 [Aspergillus pseudonomiae]KAE8400138.1 hypothetical protein BDV37DRAFT_258397 [Aspergillus pseudonomiae]